MDATRSDVEKQAKQYLKLSDSDISKLRTVDLKRLLKQVNQNADDSNSNDTKTSEQEQGINVIDVSRSFAQLTLGNHNNQQQQQQERQQHKKQGANTVPPTPKLNVIARNVATLRKQRTQPQKQRQQQHQQSVKHILTQENGEDVLKEYVDGLVNRLSAVRTRLDKKTQLSASDTLDLEESLVLDASIKRDERREINVVNELQRIQQELSIVIDVKREFLTIVEEDDDDDEAASKTHDTQPLLQKINRLENALKLIEKQSM